MWEFKHVLRVVPDATNNLSSVRTYGIIDENRNGSQIKYFGSLAKKTIKTR